MAERPGGVSTLVELLRIAQRRKWIIIQAVVLVTAVATVNAVRQPKIYSSTAQVLLNRENIAATYAGVPDVTASEDPVRYGSTQAFLARSPRLAARVVADAHVAGMTASLLLAHSSVISATNADVLTFGVEGRDPLAARTLANLYAQDFTAFRRTLDTRALRNALVQIRSRVRELRSTDGLQTASGQALVDREQQLETLAALEQQNAYVARPASAAIKVRPRPKRDAALGLMLGLVLGLGLAYLRETLDSRIRSADEIAARLGLSMLGRLATPPRELRDANALVMMEQPYSLHGEMFRMLRTNLDLARLDRQVRTLMITSGLEGEGKTTTAANLAVALAVTGREVTLVDLDLRRPSVGKYFGLKTSPGVSDVALGTVPLDDALSTVDLAGMGQHGSLRVLTSGPTPPNPAEFIATSAIADILREVTSRSDIVVIDAPPALHAAEAITLSTQVDGVVVVVRLNLAKRGSLAELRHLLDRSPATKLGFVLTGAEASGMYDFDHYAPRVYGYPDKDLVL